MSTKFDEALARSREILSQMGPAEPFLRDDEDGEHTEFQQAIYFAGQRAAQRGESPRSEDNMPKFHKAEQQRRYNLVVQACRSGKYPVGTHHLSRHGCYCVLGVVCEVAIAHTVPIEKVAGSGRYSPVKYAGETERLPDAVNTWLNMGQRIPMNPVMMAHDLSIEHSFEDGLLTLARVMGCEYTLPAAD